MKKYSLITMALVAASVAVAEVSDEQFQKLVNEIALLKGEQSDLSVLAEPASKLKLGGYGEIHGNFKQGGDDKFDIHRLIMYMGYDFNDWIKLNSEVELEHAFVADSDKGDNGGEISIEQLFVDFELSDAFNVRVGRMLAPLGIINETHEPTLFLGVERPNVEKYIIPSTWSVDGAGIFGSPLSWLSYQAYVVAGLDGSKFSAKKGVRSGRIKERGGLNDPAFTGRLDFFPFVDADLPAGQDLRIGVSGYYGGTNNKNEGGDSDPSADNTFAMYSADFEYDVSRFRFRGVVAHGKNSDADKLGGGVGEEIFGWYLEGGVSVMPESWKKGKLAEADIIPFVRYEEYDTQHKLPTGIAKTKSNDRTEVTVGVNFSLIPQLVLKADYQFMDDASSARRDNQFNLGMGWMLQ